MPNESCETPILFLVFRRPDTTRQVFERIRSARPRTLYVAADGPRKDAPGEEDLCRAVRDIVTQIDWDCDLKTLFREANQGCKTAISGGISWFFEQVDAGIILEDDLLPHPDFFRFCSELLERYGEDTRVMQIAGTNSHGGWRRDADYSYYFSHLGSIWGWATWRRAWKLCDMNMTHYGEIKAKGYLEDACASPEELQLRLANFDSVQTGRLTTCWGHQWKYSMMIHHGLSIIPNVNLITNIGFGADGTHTLGTRVSSYPWGELESPLRHPPFMIRDAVSDARQARTILRFDPGWRGGLKRMLKRSPALMGITRKLRGRPRVGVLWTR